MKVSLIRHLEPRGATGLCYGRTDLATDPEQIAAIAPRIRDHISEPHLVISSPLRRCTALAEALAEAPGETVGQTLGQTYESDERLAEINFGQWEGLTWDEIDREAFDHWASDYVHRPVPGGESWEDVQSRAIGFLGDLRPRPYDQVAVLTHAGVIRAILGAVLAVALESTWRIHLPFGSIVTIMLDANPAGDRLISLSDGV